jgi:DNA-binding transcriptional ArsR family regulator
MARGRQPTTHLVTGKHQRRALASPLRLEIIGYFEHGRELSVMEVAERLGRPAASLYFHVHKLVRAGLLVEGKIRGRGPSAEVVYRAVADRIALPVNDDAPGGRRAIVTMVRALLRQVGREFEAACRSPYLLATIPPQGIGRRHRAWLTATDAAEARRRLEAIERFLIRS